MCVSDSVVCKCVPVNVEENLLPIDLCCESALQIMGMLLLGFDIPLLYQKCY